MEPNPKHAMVRQLPLELPVLPAYDRDDLIVTQANRLAVELVDAWPQWPGPVVALVGPPGSGKSHLARIWAQASGAVAIPATDLANGMAPPSTLLVIEDFSPGKVDDAALFHTLNHIRAEGGHCLLTSASQPLQWGVVLPDLLSRLRAVQLVTIDAPDDALLSAVIFKLFADRQVEAPAMVVDWLLPRMERSLDCARKLVGEMDREALARGSKITRQVAAAALERVSGAEG